MFNFPHPQILRSDESELRITEKIGGVVILNLFQDLV